MTQVAEIQAGLERALRRANQAADRDLAERVRQEGHRLVFLLNGLMHATRMYGRGNAALRAPAVELATALAALHDLLGAVHVICVEDQIYVNDVRLRTTATEQQIVDHIVAELGRHGVGGLSIHSPMTAAALEALARAVADEQAGERPRAALADRLRALGNIELSGRYSFRLRGEQAPRRRDYAASIRRGADAVNEALANLAAGRLPNPLPVRRAVIDLADALRDEPDRACVEPFRCSTAPSGERHLLAVASLSVVLGRALGLSDSALSDLGVAAMMHDVGSTPGHEQDADAGIRPLLGQRGFHEAKIRRLRVVLEHHLRSGDDAPAGPASVPVRPSLFSRIVHIADDYDLLSARRPGRAAAVSPATALAAMWAGRGGEYDPQLLALFVQILGRYPPGTLLELNDGRWAVSVSGGRDRERFEWPVARVVRAADGSPRDASERLDLFDLKDGLGVKPIPAPASLGETIGSAIEASFGSGNAA